MARPADFLLTRVLHRDGLMLIIDKPAGLAVHAGPGGGESLEDYFDALRFGLPRAPVLAHRLDRDTTGCLVLARHPKAARKLGKLFADGAAEKTYWAICKGAPEKPSGSIEYPLDKVSNKKGWRMVVSEDGKSARTTYRVLKTSTDYSLIEAKPKTGRTHQIRAHLAEIGAPILGDPLYGDLSADERRRPMMLHARKIIVPISRSKEPICVEAAPPKEMAALIGALT